MKFKKTIISVALIFGLLILSPHMLSLKSVQDPIIKKIEQSINAKIKGDFSFAFLPYPKISANNLIILNDSGEEFLICREMKVIPDWTYVFSHKEFRAFIDLINPTINIKNLPKSNQKESLEEKKKNTNKVIKDKDLASLTRINYLKIENANIILDEDKKISSINITADLRDKVSFNGVVDIFNKKYDLVIKNLTTNNCHFELFDVLEKKQKNIKGSVSFEPMIVSNLLIKYDDVLIQKNSQIEYKNDSVIFSLFPLFKKEKMGSLNGVFNTKDSKCNAKWNYLDNKLDIVSLDLKNANISGKFANGTININLNDKFESKFNIGKIHLEKIPFINMKEKGVVSCKGTAKITSKSPNLDIESLSSNIDIIVHELKMNGPDIVLALNRLKKAQSISDINEIINGMKQTKVLNITANGNVTSLGEIATIKNVTAVIDSEIQLEINGTSNIKKQTMDLNVVVHFKDLISFNVRVSGTYDDPKFDVDKTKLLTSVLKTFVKNIAKDNKIIEKASKEIERGKRNLFKAFEKVFA